MRGMAMPMHGRRGGLASTIASRRVRKFVSDASPPAMAQTHGTVSWMSSFFEPGGSCAWWRRMLSWTQRTCLPHASSSAAIDLSFAPSGNSSSQCVSTACTTASGAPACR